MSPPPAPPMTLGNLRELGVQRARFVPNRKDRPPAVSPAFRLARNLGNRDLAS